MITCVISNVITCVISNVITCVISCMITCVISCMITCVFSCIIRQFCSRTNSKVAQLKQRSINAERIFAHQPNQHILKSTAVKSINDGSHRNNRRIKDRYSICHPNPYRICDYVINHCLCMITCVISRGNGLQPIL